jgi:hypothetical protein
LQTTALLDEDGDGVVEETVILLDSLDTPNGVAWKGGDLYVSGFDKGKGMIWKVEDIDSYVQKGEVRYIHQFHPLRRTALTLLR